ncbi:hypothetical protein CCACVL1_00137 [Corchorus capsularis]|uniref:Uncharacterized protein n=1 Tax=Corchorus capsularis TaxID=210143 RepID=A0A1R3KYD3_COCAP|nr:hypothetical protein CCACVL1_00137 [Corchorus capsularis]
MALTADRDQATESFDESIGEIDWEGNNGADSTPKVNNKEVRAKAKASSSSIATPQPRCHRKRKSALREVAEALGAIAEAIRKWSEGVPLGEVYEQVMSTEGYSEEVLVTAFDYLAQHENLARAFLIKNKRLKRIWIDNFLKK